ncbi:MAG: hypothetical protein COA96_16335 [SAR86 cluster bacterium]|uniref:PilZ domain-containing protein n=1 Tax=SAR86 cluster bacterium TaxID=2030880 RepID=A0A2A5AKG7_9GAMM|nr:MAG: hypothetical protein COA96_16335 [SAR86 cluster bacterium]
MNTLDIGNGDIIHRKEILQLLKMVISQKWSFSCVIQVKKRVATHALQLVSLNDLEGTLCVSPDPAISNMSVDDSLMFRAQSGGVSIIFQSQMVEASGAESMAGRSSLQYFGLPYKIVCTQLRKTLRANLESIADVAEVPVTLYLMNGALKEGSVMDISTAGAKFRFKEDLKQELRNPETVDACKIKLSNGVVIQTDVQLMGMVNDQEANLTFLRCQFVRMKSADEDTLESFIKEVLQ